MAATTTMVRVRVDENLKAQAAQMLALMGLTVSDAIRVFLTCVVADKEFPFALKAPNATSRGAITEANEIVKSRRACFASADAFLMTSKKPVASKRAKLPRASDYTKNFLKDWQRLSHSGRYEAIP